MLGNVPVKSYVPTRTFSVPGFFFWLRQHISSQSSRTHDREVLEAYQQSVDEQLKKVPPLLEDFLSHWKEP